MDIRPVALAILYLHPLKPNILPSHQNSSIEHHFLRTHHPLYHILHTNFHLLGPHVIHTPFNNPPSPPFPIFNSHDL
jgi:hypothetical protein